MASGAPSPPALRGRGGGGEAWPQQPLGGASIPPARLELLEEGSGLEPRTAPGHRSKSPRALCLPVPWPWRLPGLGFQVSRALQLRGSGRSWVGCNRHVLHLWSPRKLRGERCASPIRRELPVSSIRLESLVRPQNGPSLPPPTGWKSRLEASSPPGEWGLIFSVWSGKFCLPHQTWPGLLRVPIWLGLLVSPIRLGKPLSSRQMRGEDPSTLAQL